MRLAASSIIRSRLSPIAGGMIPAYATDGIETTSSACTVAFVGAAISRAAASAALLSAEPLYPTPTFAIGLGCSANPRAAIATAHGAPLSAARVSLPSIARPNVP